MNNNDTIVAQATAPGQGGIGIIRVSGKLTKKISKIILGVTLKPRVASLLPFKNRQGEEIDEGIAIYFESPNSFTGEDVLELQGHGGPIVMDMLLQEVVILGARIANPGEFSQRAFLNNKMDLLKAEAIADLIAASSEQAAKSAVQSLQGKFSKEINSLVADLIHLRTYVEAAIDFPDEEVDFLSDGKVQTELEQIQQKNKTIILEAQQGALLREGIQVVIAGMPNAGKSSLLNALSQRESAIVTHIPGTTRDVLKEEINIDGIPVHIIDTAGLRDSNDEVEKIGIDRAWKQIEQADLLLLVVDDNLYPEVAMEHHWQQLTRAPLPLIPKILVKNKIDQTSKTPQVKTDNTPTVYISARENQGIKGLIDQIKLSIGYKQTAEGKFLARTRHLNALKRSLDAVEQGMEQLVQFKAGELLAEDLKTAQQALGEITGEFSSDDLLGEIFSSFCIGK